MLCYALLRCFVLGLSKVRKWLGCLFVFCGGGKGVRDSVLMYAYMLLERFVLGLSKLREQFGCVCAVGEGWG